MTNVVAASNDSQMVVNNLLSTLQSLESSIASSVEKVIDDKIRRSRNGKCRRDFTPSTDIMHFTQATHLHLLLSLVWGSYFLHSTYFASLFVLFC